MADTAFFAFAQFMQKYFESAAYHEAGHMTAAVVQGMPVDARGIQIDMRGHGIAHYWMREPGDAVNNSSQDQRERKLSVISLYAAWIAQKKFFPDCPTDGRRLDDHKADRLLKEINPAGGAELAITREDLLQRTERLVVKYFPVIEGLATTLLARPDTLFPAEVLKVASVWAATSQGKSMNGNEVVEYFQRLGIPALLRDSKSGTYYPAGDIPIYDSLA